MHFVNFTTHRAEQYYAVMCNSSLRISVLGLVMLLAQHELHPCNRSIQCITLYYAAHISII